MQKILAITKFLATLFVIFMIWLAYTLISVAYQSFDNENLDYIPEDSIFVIRIDAKKIINMSSSSVIVNEDEEVIELLREIFQNKEGTSTIKPVGIAINSDFILFNQSEGDQQFTGILVNLLSPHLFKRNMPDIFGESVAISVNGDVGLIYFKSLTSESKSISKNQLQEKADAILKEKSNFDMSQLGKVKGNLVAQSWYKRGVLKNVDLSNNTQLSFIVTDDELIVDGTLAFENTYSSTLRKELKPDGLHISSDQIDGFLSDTLSSFFEALHLPSSNVRGISLNYYELQLINDPIYFPAPKFDAIITFENDFPLEEAIDSLASTKHSRKINNESISYRGLKLYFRQLDAKTIYIGVSKNAKIMGRDSRLSTWIQGTPSSLTTVNGSVLLKGAVSMTPFFTPTKLFFNDVKEIGVRIDTPKNGVSKIHGVIQFKEGKRVLNAIVKFVLHAN